MTRNDISIAALLMVLLFLGACSAEDSEPTTENTAISRSDELRKAPNFEVETLQGDTVSLQTTMSENKPMVVYFTASWCPVCAKNWPVLSEVYPDYKDELDFVAIGIDPTDTREVMTRLAREKGFTFPTTWGHPQIMVDFGVESQATTVGINRDGKIAFQKNKTALSEKEYRKLFDRLVGQ
ncbi:peroxiredoxin family protein [Fodinibius sediminis]|uniref:Peroxiredoxin n=1 Tax=Fodinibius sediminis TaxID=1214077 RepID=A0A521CL53_9BACT|nr:TlpA disulfide reductase family protein [Fodinibius sediminis]SMO60197.1 Peroxiredoxin [Fodinibius sediminis]